MATVDSLDFQQFVSERERERTARTGSDPHGYAYVSDRNTRATFERAKAVELAVSAAVRMFKHIGKAELLGRAVKIGPRQFPRVHALACECAETLGTATPTLYVVNNPHLNAATYGTNDDSFILVHSALVDHLTDRELISVIGHEVGHIHNKHVVYLTTMYYLTHMAGLFLRSIALPATLALRAWSRRAEVTCDRAGLLCGRDLDASLRALTKLALGSRKLYDELNIDAFLEQHEEGKESVGRFGELWATHPFLPKRVLALKAFAESELYQRHVGAGQSGRTIAEVDELVSDLIKVVG